MEVHGTAELARPPSLENRQKRFGRGPVAGRTRSVAHQRTAGRLERQGETVIASPFDGGDAIAPAHFRCEGLRRAEEALKGGCEVVLVALHGRTGDAEKRSHFTGVTPWATWNVLRQEWGKFRIPGDRCRCTPTRS